MSSVLSERLRETLQPMPEGLQTNVNRARVSLARVVSISAAVSSDRKVYEEVFLPDELLEKYCLR